MSKKIYLEKIISSATEKLDAITGRIEESVNAQVEKLEETTNLLTQILNQTGLTQQQKVFNGSTLSALTLKSLPFTDVGAEMCRLITYPAGGNTNEIHMSARQLEFARNNSQNYISHYVDLTDIEIFSFSRKTAGSYAENFRIKINDSLVYEETGVIDTTGTNKDISVSEFTGMCKISYQGYGNNTTSSVKAIFYDLALIHAGVSPKYLFENNDSISFVNNVIVRSKNYLDNIALGYITIPLSDATIAQLNTLLTVGETDNIAILNFRSDFETKINNIETPIGRLTENTDFTNLYIGLEFCGADSSISSFTVRYV